MNAESVVGIAVNVANVYVASGPLKVVSALHRQSGVHPGLKDVANAALTAAVARKIASVQRC